MTSSIDKIVRVTDTYANIKANMVSPQIAYATDTDATANVEPGTPITREASTFHILAIQNHVDSSTGAVTHADNHFGALKLWDKAIYDATSLPTISSDEDIVHKKYVDDTIAALSFSTLDYDNDDWDASDPVYQAGRTFYNRRGWVQSYTDDSDVLVEHGATLLSKFTNETGVTINKGQPLWVSGVNSGGTNFKVELATCLEPDQNYLVGVAASDALNGEEVYFMQKGVISGIDTSSLNTTDPVYLGSTAGTLTTSTPGYPCRHVLIGGCLVSDAVNGVLGVNTMEVNHEDEFEGSVIEKLALYITTSGANIYVELEANGGGNFHAQAEGGYYEVDATTGAGVGGRAQVQITAGTATSPVKNYVYAEISGGAAVLTHSTSRPTSGYIMICEITVLDSTSTVSYGPRMFRRWTNAKVNGGADDIGLLVGVAERLRLEGAKYDTGISQTTTITTNPASMDNLKVEATAGVVYQLWRQNTSAIDTTVDGVWVANASGAGTLTQWQRITDLAQCLELEDGTAITNNNRFNLTIFYCINYNGQTEVFVNLPTDVYASDDNAYRDINNTAVVSVPDSIRSTAYLGLRIPLKYTTAASGTLTFLGTPTTISLLGNPIGLSGVSSSTTASSEFSDGVFRVFDNGDSTKELAFECSGITTGTTRTLTVPDASGTIALTSGVVDGTGTANKLPKWSDSNTLTDSTVIETATGVGVEIATPQSKLHVHEASASDNFVQVTNTITGSGSSSAGTRMGVTSDGTAVFGSMSASTETALYSAGLERLRIDDSGYIGIGTSPTVPVDISKNISTTTLKLKNTNTGTTGYTQANLENDGSSKLAIGCVGTGFTTTSYADSCYVVNAGQSHMDVKSTGDIRLVAGSEDSSTNTKVTIGTDGSVTMPDVYSDTVGVTNRDLFIDDTGKLGYVSSSARYKENVVGIEDTSWVHQLRPVSFDYKEEHGGYHSEGLIAEEVEAVREDLVSYNEVFEDEPITDANGLEWFEDGWEPTYKKVYYGREVETVSYHKLITPLLNEVQKLKKYNDEQAYLIAQLSARLDALEAK